MTIVYNSNTGFTKRYAEMLSSNLGIKCVSFKDRKKVDKKEKIIFMSWIFANNITKLKKVKKYNVSYVIGVGMNKPTEENTNLLITTNKIMDSSRFFYLQGGLDYSKLKGIKRAMMKLVANSLIKDNKLNPEEAEVMKNGGDFVKEEIVIEMAKKIDIL